ncbi:hypothetical protein Scep_001208 [Stephania cephalantha]|uniref:Uncharacterized protein n=1 Tax=Stephania cephalantha TaxID=152367 RepID=A0AAP0L7H4_9MAGN
MATMSLWTSPMVEVPHFEAAEWRGTWVFQLVSGQGRGSRWGELGTREAVEGWACAMVC